MADMLLSAPVSDLEFAGALEALSPQLPVAVAVSGGADSMALLRLTLRWLQAQGQSASLRAFTVDHALREGSAAEAQQVGAWCQALHISHQILRWPGDKPRSDIQAAARRARYSLLSKACKQHGAQNLLLAHHLEDQAETFLLRLGRGSGVDGLAAMAPERLWNGVRLLRPLLGFSRERLRATLMASGQDWLEDPGNNDPRFARARARNVLADLAEAGVSAARLAATAGRMRRAREALEIATAQHLSLTVHWEQTGFASLSVAALLAAPEEIGLRVLAKVLMAVGGHEYPPRLVRLERLYHWLAQQTPTGGRTLYGCRILPRRDRMLIVRELSAVGPEIALKPGETALWDNRFHVQLDGDEDQPRSASYTVHALGCAGMQQLRRARPGKLPLGAVCQAAPGLWQGPELLAAPLLGFCNLDHKAVASAFKARFAPLNMVLPGNPASGLNS